MLHGLYLYLVGRGLGSELREADNVRQADGNGAELLRRRHLAQLQLEFDGEGDC